jgi:hypothetical protein
MGVRIRHLGAAAHRVRHSHAARTVSGAHTKQLVAKSAELKRGVRVFGFESVHNARKGAATLGARRKNSPGVLIVPRTVDGVSVSRAELQAAVAALRQLPAADIELIAKAGIQIHLVPTQGLEDNLLGATTIVQDHTGGRWRPTVIRIAARANLPGSESLPEIVQHEFGHAVSVIRNQDRSEDAAIAYAKRY